MSLGILDQLAEEAFHLGTLNFVCLDDLGRLRPQRYEGLPVAAGLEGKKRADRRCHDQQRNPQGVRLPAQFRAEFLQFTQLRGAGR